MEHLYVPKGVWTQERFQIFDSEKKLALIEELKKEMQTLGILKKKNALQKNFKQVDSLVNLVSKLETDIQQTLT